MFVIKGSIVLYYLLVSSTYIYYKLYPIWPNLYNKLVLKTYSFLSNQIVIFALIILFFIFINHYANKASVVILYSMCSRPKHRSYITYNKEYSLLCLIFITKLLSSKTEKCSSRSIIVSLHCCLEMQLNDSLAMYGPPSICDILHVTVWNFFFKKQLFLKCYAPYACVKDNLMQLCFENDR